MHEMYADFLAVVNLDGIEHLLQIILVGASIVVSGMTAYRGLGLSLKLEALGSKTRMAHNHKIINLALANLISLIPLLFIYSYEFTVVNHPKIISLLESIFEYGAMICFLMVMIHMLKTETDGIKSFYACWRHHVPEEGE